jgi:hypothetical protein
MEDFGPVTQGFREARRTRRNNHEFLHVYGIVRMGAPIDDIHHRHRQSHRIITAQIAEQRFARCSSTRMCHRQRNGQKCIGAQPRLVLGTIKLQHDGIDGRQIMHIHTNDCRGNLAVYIRHGLTDTLATKTGFVAIAQFDRFTDTGRCARRDNGTPHESPRHEHVGLNGRVATGINYLSCANAFDGCHFHRSPKIKSFVH